MKAALHVLHYIHFTHEYSISFTSDDTVHMHSYVHFLLSTDSKAYGDAVPPKLGYSNTLLVYRDTCWGSQMISIVANGTLLLLLASGISLPVSPTQVIIFLTLMPLPSSAMTTMHALSGSTI